MILDAFSERLGRLAVIAATEQPLPRDLGEWAHAHLQDLADLRRWRSALPLAMGKALRDRRILAAAAAADTPDVWPLARALYAEATKIQSGRACAGTGDPAPTTLRGALQIAHAWYPLPESERTFERLLTKGPLVCHPFGFPIDP